MRLRTFWALALMLDLALWAAIVVGVAALLSGCASVPKDDWAAIAKAVGGQYEEPRP